MTAGHHRLFSRTALSVLGLVVVLAGCSGDDTRVSTTSVANHGEVVGATTEPVPTVAEDLIAVREAGCEAPAGSPISLADEPARWLSYGTYFRWRDPQGCPVRIDVISETAGPEHCGWQDARYITIGRQLGTSIGRTFSPEQSNRYVWNPGAVIQGLAPGRTLATADLPPSASDSGYRLGDQALWIDAQDETVVYVVTGDEADRYIRDPQAGLCM